MVGEGGDISAGFTTEDAGGPNGFDVLGTPWTRDAFRWSHLAGQGRRPRASHPRGSCCGHWAGCVRAP
jgi:hypothetical protein